MKPETNLNDTCGKNVFFVLGMHRAGTSFLTELLGKLGLQLPKLLATGAEDNERGFFEPLNIVSQHDDWLEKNGMRWDCVPSIEKIEFNSNINETTRSLMRAFSQNYPGKTPAVLKDPRLSILLPLWKGVIDALGLEDYYLITFRDPVSVAKSLQKRNGISEEHACLLWLIHVISSERNTRNKKRSFLHFPNWVVNGNDELGRLEQQLGIRFPVDHRQLDISTVFASDLVHQQANETPSDRGTILWFCLEIYKQIVNLQNDPNDSGVLTKLDFLISEHGNLVFAFSDMFSQSSKLLVKGGHAIKEKERTIKEKEHTINEKERTIKEKEHTINEKEHTINEKERTIKEKEHTINEKERNENRLKSQKLQLQSELQDSLSHLERYSEYPIESGLKSVLWGVARGFFRAVPMNPAKKSAVASSLRHKLRKIDPVFRNKNDLIKSSQTLIYEVDPTTIQLDSSLNPEISIVVPVYNQLAHTLMCLDCLALQISPFSFEVIVVDDCSTDETEEILINIPHLKYIRNEENVGFISSCNRGANESSGEYIVFLNNDTLPSPDWLHQLRLTFENYGNVGVVGSKLVFSNGNLQEAGGIIWNDATGWNWGRGENPNHPKYNYVRDVDYVSGCSFMIPRELFLETCSFDKDLEFAYYEDTSKCFQLRRLGYRILYQPLSHLIHFEGVSCGIDITKGLKKYQITNREIFKEKHKKLLSTHLSSGENPEVASDRTVKGHILIIDAETPRPDQDSGSVDMFNLIRILVNDGYRVHFIPQTNFSHLGSYTNTLMSLGVECIYAPFYVSLESYLRERGDVFDYIFMCRMPVAQNSIRDVKKYAPSAATIFYTVDLHFLREQREAKISGNNKKIRAAEKNREIELTLISKTDIAIVLSGFEESLLIKLGYSNICKLPLIRDIGEPTSKNFEDRSGVVFVGGFRHTPNIDSVNWLIEDVWPEVRNQLKIRNLPTFKLRIVGSHMPSRFEELRAYDVEPIGFVHDLKDEFNRVRLSLAPIRFGAGLKGKMATSFEYGVPVVGTSIAFEGMPKEGVDELVASADNAKDFAQIIIDLYYDETRWKTIRSAGVDYVQNHYSLESLTPVVINILNQADENKNNKL